MHAAAEVDQSAGALDQGGQSVWRQGVDRQDSCMSLGCRIAALKAVDTGIVDDGVHAADAIDLICNAPSLDGATEIANDDACRPRRQVGDRLGSCQGACVKNDLMAVFNQCSCRCAAEPVRAAGNKDATHGSSTSG